MATVTTSNRTLKSWKEFFSINGNVLDYAGERSDEVEANPSIPYCLNLQVVEGVVGPVSISQTQSDSSLV